MTVNKRKLLIWIPLVAILANGAAYLIVTNLRASPSAEPPGAVAKLTVGRSSTDLPEHKRGGPADDQDLEARALARRSAGLAALDSGEYEKALIDFTEARALMGDKANVSELLRVTEDLRSKRDRAAAPPPRPTHVAAAPSPPAPRPPMRPAVGRRLAVRETPIPIIEPAPAPPPPPSSGLLIVSTTPRGLLVHVDDAAVDLSPMRTKVKPGSHRVALFDGDRKVYEATVDVKEGGTATLVKDLPVETASETSPPREGPPPPPAPAPPVTRADTPRAVAMRTPVPLAPRSRPASVVPPPVPSTVDTGTLQITSPGLYGVVWVNGRPRGYPPLEVGELASGPAKIEVRVNGIEKRTATVVVAPGRIINVDLR
jgi:hypothetical protein